MKPSINKELETKITELKKSLDEKSLKLSSASMGEKEEECGDTFYYQYIRDLYQYIEYNQKYTDSRFSDLWNRIYEHEQGHLPKIQTPSQMQNVIDVLGLGNDYEVQKRTIYASREKKWTFNATLKK